MTKQQSQNKKLIQNLYFFDKENYKMGIRFDGPQGRMVFVLRFPFGYKNVQSLSQHVDFTSYMDWLGEVRELSLRPIINKINLLVQTGKWGMATNTVNLKIYDFLKVHDVVEVRLWLDKISGLDKMYYLCFDFMKVLKNGSFKRMATSSLVITCVEILDHGKARIARAPKFLRDFFAMMMPKAGSQDDRPKPKCDFGEKSLGRCLADYKSNAKFIFENSYRTTLENSNFIGNIYFSNYSKWINSTKDLYLNQHVPAFFRKSAFRGEFATIEYKVSHYYEAMPFDEIIVRMYVAAIFANGIVLHYTVSKKVENLAEVKLAAVVQKIVFVKYLKSRLKIAKIPRNIRSLFENDRAAK